MRKLRVLLVDDHELIREGIAVFLGKQADIEVVGQAADGQAAVQLADQLAPDVVIMDITMPLMNGLEATDAILSRNPRVRVIGLSMHPPDDMADAMFHVGARAYLPKDSPPKVLIEAIRSVAAVGHFAV